MSKTKRTYPPISEMLLKSLNRDFPDVLPRKLLSEFELGRLVGQQEVIDKLKSEAEEREDYV